MKYELTLTEQRHVRTALRHLRIQIGAWKPIAAGLHLAYDTVEKVVNERRPVTVNVAFRVAHFLEVPLETLLSGSFLPGACPRCGFIPDFINEPTVVEDAPPERPSPRGGLKLVK